MNDRSSAPRTRSRFSLWRWLVWLRACSLVVLLWLYIDSASTQEPGRWGTVLEATAAPITYLPYLSMSDADRFYQSLVFEGCLFPSFSGQQISYYEQLCSVDTDDYRTFTVTALPNKLWSDGTPFNLGDVFFTYSAIIQDNYWNLPWLEHFRSIDVDLVDNQVVVTFPQASVDNMIFFTNFILPQHLLANTPLESYVSSFATTPVGTSCATLRISERDPQSVIYNFDACQDIPIKFYQVKQLANTDELLAYAQQNARAITFLMDDYPVAGFTRNPILLNTYATVFFNTSSDKLPVDLREKLSAWLWDVINTYGSDDHIVPDPWLFSLPESDGLTGSDFVATRQPTLASEPDPEPYPDLPSELTFRGVDDGRTVTYRIGESIADRVLLLFSFEEVFDRVSVTYNATPEFFPESFDPQAQTTYYNLNPTLRNIAVGRNTYTIRGYLDDEVAATYTLDVRYLEDDTTTTPSDSADLPAPRVQPLRVIYGGWDSFAWYIATLLQDVIDAYGLQDYFVLEHYPQDELFDGKLQARDYDMVISSLNLWLRNDLSPLLQTDDPIINPSLFTNATFAARIREYFLAASPAAQGTAQERISLNYQDSYPFVLLGKEVGAFLINEQIDFSFPWRLYVLGWRKDFLQDLHVYSQYTVHRDRVLDPRYAQAFVATHIGDIPLIGAPVQARLVDQWWISTDELDAADTLDSEDNGGDEALDDDSVPALLQLMETE